MNQKHCGSVASEVEGLRRDLTVYLGTADDMNDKSLPDPNVTGIKLPSIVKPLWMESCERELLQASPPFVGPQVTSHVYKISGSLLILIPDGSSDFEISPMTKQGESEAC